MPRQPLALGCCLFALGLLGGPSPVSGQFLIEPRYDDLDSSILSGEESALVDPEPLAPLEASPHAAEPTPAERPESDESADAASDSANDEGDEDEDEDAEEIATPVTAGYGAQSVATYDTQTGGWLPDYNQTSTSWMRELEPPAGLIECTCDGVQPGPRVRVWRSLVKPTDPSIDQRCVACVKEPCLGYETVEEEYRAVLYRCFESTEPFKRGGCEAGQWFEETGDKRIRKLHPCEIKVPVKYQKPVVKYRDVYYYIRCDNGN